MIQKNKILTALTLISLFTFSSVTQASLLELRGAYTILQSKPEEINNANGPGFPQFEQMTGFSADAMTNLPAMPVGLGVRFERFSTDASNASGSIDGKFERTSLLISKRIIDTGLYFGSIATIGLTNQLNYDETVLGTKTSYKATSGLTASLGVEGGLNLGIIKAGIEAGYLYAPLGKLKYSNGTDVVNVDGSNTKVDLSAPYARAVVGIGF